MIHRIDASHAQFDQQLAALLDFPEKDRSSIVRIVREIIVDVRSRGDHALVELSNRFDKRAVQNMDQLIVDKSRLERAFRALESHKAEALRFSADRIRRYHEEQLKAGFKSWEFEDDLGNIIT